MKKLLLIAIIASGFAHPFLVHADTACDASTPGAQCTTVNQLGDQTGVETCTCPTTPTATAPAAAPTPAVSTQSSGFVPLTNIPGLTTGAGTGATEAGLATFLNNLYKYLIGLAAVLAVIEIIWGGIEISTQDSVSKHDAGRERIQQAILGLVLVLSPYLVFSIINPSILNLSLNLPPIKQTTLNSTTTPSVLQSALQEGSSGGTGYYTPSATPTPCTNNDCTQAIKDCQNSVSATSGKTITTIVACMNGSQVDGDTIVVSGSSGVCPGQETKALICEILQNE